MALTPALVSPVVRAARLVALSHPDGRGGALVVLEDDGGRVGHGELTAAAGFSAPLAALLPLADAALAALRGGADGLALVASGALPGPVAFAVETALLDLAAQRDGVPVAALLAPDPTARVAVNALVHDVDAARAAVARGFRTLKLKLWRPADVALAAAIRSAVGRETELRVDLNAAFSAADAHAALAALAPLDVAYVEDPAATLDVAAWGALADLGVPLAVDRGASAPEGLALAEAGAARVAVLKPADGGLAATVALARRYEAAGAEVVVTCALEGPVGVAAALHVACALRLERAAGLVAPTPGPHPPVVAGHMALPAAAGLGVAPEAPA